MELIRKVEFYLEVDGKMTVMVVPRARLTRGHVMMRILPVLSLALRQFQLLSSGLQQYLKSGYVTSSKFVKEFIKNHIM